MNRCIEDDTFVQVRAKHCENRPFRIQASILSHVSSKQHAIAGILSIPPEASSSDVPAVLDLTAFETSAVMMFLFWLVNRRLPKLLTECALQAQPNSLSPTAKSDQKPDQIARFTQRDKEELYRVGMIEAWRLGAALGSATFMNDVLMLVAMLLERDEVLAHRSHDPEYSATIVWARRAYDAMEDSPAQRRELQGFAVDVAVKRVFDVGASGLMLSPAERRALSGNAGFAANVFGSLGGQIGTSGVGIGEFVREYMVDT
jgi:hypothetical protein